jgi:hypothetical protein
MSSFLVKVAKAFIRPAAHPVRRNEFSSNPPTINTIQLIGQKKTERIYKLLPGNLYGICTGT